MEGDYIPNSHKKIYYFWYYFSVTGIEKHSNVTFFFKNLGTQGKIFTFGFKPVYKSEPSSRAWKRIPGKFEYHVSFIIIHLEKE